MKPKANRAGDMKAASKYDQCQTPAYAVTPLLPYLPDNWQIWEPASGDGIMGRALVSNSGRSVYMTDILWGDNFFEYTPKFRWDAIVTNPPYSVKYPWLEHCYALGKPFALLLPLESWGTARGQASFEKYGVEVILLDKRVDFGMPGIGFDESSAQFPVAWFTHGLNIGAPVTYAKLNKPARKRAPKTAVVEVA